MGAAKNASFKLISIIFLILAILFGMGTLTSFVMAPLLGGSPFGVLIIGGIITVVLFFLFLYAREKGRGH